MYSSLVLLSPRAARPPQVSLVSRRRLITRKLLIARCSCLDAREHLLRRLDREVDVLLRVLEPGEAQPRTATARGTRPPRASPGATSRTCPCPTPSRPRSCVTGPAQKKRPNIPRMVPPHTACPAALPAARMPSMRRFVVIASMYSYAPSSPRISSVSMPATIASGLPDSVPAWYIGPAGATTSMISRLPPYAPTGRPPPITLPIVVRSGVTPQYSCAHPLEIRNPVITSSKLSSAPSAVVTLAEALEEGLVRDDEPGVAHDGLEDHARDLTLVLLEDLLHRLEVVVRRAQRRVRRRLRARRASPGARASRRRSPPARGTGSAWPW